MGWLIYSIGFLAQAFFSARIIVQWLMSERAHKVLSPTVFWVLSIIASYLLCIYGFLRHDFAIVLGQFISYYVYLWNLKAKGVWRPLSRLWKGLLLLTPVVAMVCVAGDAERFADTFFNTDAIPVWLIVYGSAGQVVFTLRFLYQYVVSRRAGESELPAGFWLLSLLGSLLIVSYAIFRADPVLIVGQSFGLVAYTRNLMIGSKARRRAKTGVSDSQKR